MPSTAGYFTLNYYDSLPQIVPIWVFRKISCKIPWRRLQYQPIYREAKKRTQPNEVDDDLQ